jgi:hypothetical protein
MYKDGIMKSTKNCFKNRGVGRQGKERAIES